MGLSSGLGRASWVLWRYSKGLHDNHGSVVGALHGPIAPGGTHLSSQLRALKRAVVDGEHSAVAEGPDSYFLYRMARLPFLLHERIELHVPSLLLVLRLAGL